MRNRLAPCVCVALALAGTALAADELAGKLPADTVLYAEVDLAKLRETGLRYLRFMDPERARDVEFQVKTLVESLKALAAHQEFRPALFDSVGEAKLYFVLMAKAEPEVKTHTWKSPKWDYEKGERIPGEFEEHTYTTRKEFAFSFVVETPEDVGEDFLEQVRALEERLREEDAGDETHGWKEVEVEEGEMIADASGDVTLGRFGNYLVMSDTNPVELWAALVAPARPSLAESDVYRRLKGDGDESLGLFFVNLRTLLDKAEESLMREVAEAEANAEGDGGGEDGGFDEGAWRVEMARTGLETFMAAQRILSLDKMRAAGTSAAMSIGDEFARTGVTASLHLGRPVSPTLAAILDGGHALEAPDMGQHEGLAVACRLGLEEIFTDVTANLGERFAGPFAGVMGLMKTQIGYDLGELVEGFAGDVYVFVDFKKKEQVKRTWDPEKDEIVTKKVVEPAAELFVLVGLGDSEAFSAMLSAVHAKVAAAGGFVPVGKRSFLGTDVYMTGRGADQEGAEPDGVSSFAAAVVGRHLAFGSWKDVTGLIRRARAGAEGASESLARLIAAHPDANLVLAVPGDLNRKFQEMLTEEGQNPLELVRKTLLEELPLPEEDEELARTIKESLGRLLDDLVAIGEKAQSRSSGDTGHGSYGEDFYEIKFESRFRK